MIKNRVIWAFYEQETESFSTEVTVHEAEDEFELEFGDGGIMDHENFSKRDGEKILTLDEDGNVLSKDVNFNNIINAKKEPPTDEEKAILQHRWPTDEEKEAATDEEKEASFQLTFLSKSVKGQTLAEYQAASTGTHMDDE